MGWECLELALIRATLRACKEGPRPVAGKEAEKGSRLQPLFVRDPAAGVRGRVFFCLFVCLSFLGLHPRHMEVPRLGV